jgi:hypothetical protein
LGWQRTDVGTLGHLNAVRTLRTQFEETRSDGSSESGVIASLGIMSLDQETHSYAPRATGSGHAERG